jgi:M6 family metalloprotease-like protein
MMKKNTLLKIVGFPLFGLLLAGLSGCSITIWGLTKTNTSNSGLVSTSKDGSTYGATSLSYTASGTNYKAQATSFTQSDVELNSTGYMMPSTGKVNVLVIPVIVDDFSTNATEGVRNDISKAFFGDPSDTSWESLASYYYKSSYGQLLLNGVVAPWYESGYTSKELSALTYGGTNSSIKSSYEPTWTILENAVAWYEKNYSTDLSEFDSNSDGVIDAVWMVYSAPDYGNDNSLDSTDFWAYTYSDLDPYYDAIENGGKVSSCIPFRYSWASYDFLYEGYGTSGVDAHTYIHETGHLMGLDDYYVSSTATNYTTNYGPMGRIDMMDFNIIDHDAYSKFALGWIKPYVVSGATTITLKPSATTGQAILIPTSGGKPTSAFDEYMLLEYYTPTGLNAHDVAKSYEGKDQQGVNESGIRVWHVDKNILQAHMGKTKNDKGATVDTAYFDPNPVKTLYTNGADQDYSFPDDIAPEDDNLHTSDDMTNQDDDFYTSYTTNNSKDYSDATTATQNFFVSPELQIVRAKSSGSAVIDSAALFKQGSTFGTENDASKDFSFYSPAVVLDYNCSGTDWDNAAKIKLPYSFTVTSLTDDAATLTLTKLA